MGACMDVRLGAEARRRGARRLVTARRGIPFLGIAIAFLVVGLTGRRAFLAIGLAFLVIGVVFMARQRSESE
jgi:hypothetical protein